nr:immunoglobulin heavy chain junction region [Macaca mulatta]
CVKDRGSIAEGLNYFDYW